MKIAILSRGPSLYSTRRLVQAGCERGHDMRVLNPLHVSMTLRSNTPALLYEGRPIETFDFVIPRIGASITFYGMAVVRQFEMMGVLTLNEADAIARSRDKLRCLQLLSRHDIGIPSTVITRRRRDVLPAIDLVGGTPVIIKLLEGTQGIGVILADSQQSARSVIDTLHGLKQNILIQEFVKDAQGTDIRAFVVGRKVVGAMRRKARAGEFRSNVHLGGDSEAVSLPKEYRDAAVRAAQVVGLRVAGVDLLESKGGPLVMEVNSSPGLEGIEAATGLNVAGAVIELAERQLKGRAPNGA
jgi:ribosomal protein S6--L-glutamate ligase